MGSKSRGCPDLPFDVLQDTCRVDCSATCYWIWASARTVVIVFVKRSPASLDVCTHLRLLWQPAAPLEPFYRGDNRRSVCWMRRDALVAPSGYHQDSTPSRYFCPPTTQLLQNGSSRCLAERRPH